MLILQGHTAPILSVAYAPNSLTLASGGVDRSVRLWDLATGRTTLAITDVGGPVLSLAFAPEGRTLAVGTTSLVTLWDLETRQPNFALHGERGGTYVVAFIPEARLIALSGYLDPAITLWDRTARRYGSEKLNGHRGGVLAVATCGAQPRLVSGGGLPNAGELFLWDCLSATCLHSFEESTRVPFLPPYRRRAPAHDAPVYSVALSGDGRLVASGSRDQLVKLWDAETGSLMAILRHHTSVVVAVSFMAGGWGLLSADDRGKVCLWDVETRRLRHSWDWQVGQLRSVVFAPNGMTAAAGGNRDVIVWDMDDLDR